MSEERAHLVVSARTGAVWELVIGLEVHCQLATETKLFCGCANRFGAPPNTLTCPVCTGQPGALPVLNERALRLAARAALAVGATVAPESRFARKNYFYCDLPKGYQISQYDRPLAQGGGVVLPSGKRIALERIHVEEDAGKAIHDRGDVTLVDLNRAGVPLIESVSRAELRSAEEAHDYLVALKEILRFAGVSDCDMEKGSLRCDVNVSVHRPGEPWGAKVELKNLNSFRNVRDAIVHEARRQIEGLESGAPERAPVQETRLWDPDAAETRSMRRKEDAHDYRYFPEPDLPPLRADPALLREERARLPELPQARRARYVAELGLSEYDAGVLSGSRELADYFETVAARSGDPKAAANWVANDVLAAAGGDPAALSPTPARLAELLALVADGALHRAAARRVFRALLERDASPAALVRELGLETLDDEEELDRWCRDALSGKESVAADVRAGRVKALGALIGPVMRASAGRADPERVRALLLRLIEEGG